MISNIINKHCIELILILTYIYNKLNIIYYIKNNKIIFNLL